MTKLVNDTEKIGKDKSIRKEYPAESASYVQKILQNCSELRYIQSRLFHVEFKSLRKKLTI